MVFLFRYSLNWISMWPFSGMCAHASGMCDHAFLTQCLYHKLGSLLDCFSVSKKNKTNSETVKIPCVLRPELYKC